MAQRSEIAAVYLAGVAQGVALVTFPAASAVFTAVGDYGLSSTEYGGMFVPQAITAIGASLLGAGLARRLGAKHIYLLGLVANLLAMSLLIVSSLVMRQHILAYGLLLVATASLGVGFGFTVPTLNTFAAAFFPRRVDRAVLGLNALLGLGTALAPLFVALFVGLGIWWGLPVLVAGAIVGLLLFSRRLPLNEGVQAAAKGGQDAPPATRLPARFWLFAAFALVYGICETINANWASLYMTRELGASATMASLALTVFWSSVTGGRIVFAAIEKFFPPSRTCQLLPWVVTGALVVTALLPKGAPLLGIATLALAGLGCSALLPLAISFGQQQLPGIASSVAGGLIAFYQIGYGIAAFGVGPLQGRAGLNLSVIYGATAVVALSLAVLAVFVVRSPQRQPTGP